MTTTNAMSYQDPHDGLQDQRKKKPLIPLPPGLMPPSPGKKILTEPPNILVCFKSMKQQLEEAKVEREQKKKSKRLNRAKSCELRASILYSGCDCERRNGLQDQCPRTGCQGSPECLTIPPTCPPSDFANGKHLQKKYEKLLKRRKNALSEGKNGKNGKKKVNVDYDCFPLDFLIGEDGLCPICCQPMDHQMEKSPKLPTHLSKPMNIDMPDDCCCHKH